MEERTTTAPGAQDPCPHCGRAVGDAWLVCAWCGEQIAAPAELPVGATLADGRYQVLGIIGRGGFGITYEVGDTRLKRRVAVKELFPESAVRHGSMVLTPPQGRASFRAARDRFLREARVLARFTHPGIVRVYEVFEEHGTAYLVMERLSGRTLVDVLRARNEPFTEDEVLDVAARVAAALRPVHAAGVLHRDVNPSNVMLTEHGRIVVIDFGLARDFDQGQTMGMTRMVTPGYAPLEQYRGEGRFGPTTDVYGLAATCYRLGTGRVPVAAVERDAGGDLPSPHKLNPAISKPVSDGLLDGLEIEPSHRPQDLDAFLARLGIRWLPDSPRSLLLGSVGAAPADLAVDERTIGSDPGSVAGLGTPSTGPTEFADPGPAVARAAGPSPSPAVAAAAPPAPPAPLAPVPGTTPSAAWSEPDEPASRLATEIVSPARPAATDRFTDPPLPDPPPDPRADTDPELDHDATVVPERFAASPSVLEADEDRTWSPGDDRASDATRGAPTGWDLDRSDPPGSVADHADRLDPAEIAVAGPAGPPNRRLVALPLGILAVAAASAAPLILVALVVLVVLPLLATLGDAAAQRARAAQGFASGRVDRLPTGVVVPSRFLRNVATSVVRSSPIVGMGAVALACWYLLGELSVPQGVLDVVLRLIGGGTVAFLLLTAREGSSRFRTGEGIDELARRSAPGGRVTERVVVSWLVMSILVLAALWLTPDPFPLP